MMHSSLGISNEEHHHSCPVPQVDEYVEPEKRPKTNKRSINIAPWKRCVIHTSNESLLGSEEI